MNSVLVNLSTWGKSTGLIIASTGYRSRDAAVHAIAVLLQNDHHARMWRSSCCAIKARRTPIARPMLAYLQSRLHCSPFFSSSSNSPFVPHSFKPNETGSCWVTVIFVISTIPSLRRLVAASAICLRLGATQSVELDNRYWLPWPPSHKANQLGLHIPAYPLVFNDLQLPQHLQGLTCFRQTSITMNLHNRVGASLQDNFMQPYPLQDDKPKIKDMTPEAIACRCPRRLRLPMTKVYSKDINLG